MKKNKEINTSNLSFKERILQSKHDDTESKSNEELNTKQDFTKLYINLYKENYYYLEKIRRREIRKASKVFLIIVAITILIFILYNKSGLKDSLSILGYFWIIVIGLIAILTSFKVITNPNSRNSKGEVKFISEFKNRIIRPIIQNVLPNSNIYFESGISSKYYDISSQNAYNEYVSGNLIKTKLEINSKEKFSTDVSICDVKTILVDEDEDGHERRKVTFNGMFSMVSLPKNFNGNMNLMKNQGIFFNNNNKLEMDMTEFENVFDIETDNKISTMQWLTSDIMTGFLRLYRKSGILFEFGIRQDILCIKFYTNNLLDNNIFKSKMSLEDMKQYNKNLEIIKEIIEYLVSTYSFVDF